MDSKFPVLGFGGSLWSLNAFQTRGNSQSMFNPCTEVRHETLGSNPAGVSGSRDLNLRGLKRKWSDAGYEEFEGEFSLRRSPSSSDSSSNSSTSNSTLSSAKETDEESSMEVDLNFHLCLGGNEILKPKNDVSDFDKVVKSGVLTDPKLSLSASSSSSSITTASPGPTHTVEFHIGTFSNAIQAVSVDSAQLRPVLPVASSSSSVTWERIRSISCRCSGNSVCRMCKREIYQESAEDGSVECYNVRYRDRMCHMETHLQSAEGSYDLISSDGGGRCLFPNCSKSAQLSVNFCKMQSRALDEYCGAPDYTKRARGGVSFRIPHGGGKRCHFNGCSKNAMANNDFCKHHNRQKKCPWGHPGSDFGKGEPPCDLRARGKSGLCSVHRALVQDQRIHGGTTIKSNNISELRFPKIEPMDSCVGNGHNFANAVKIIDSQHASKSPSELRAFQLQCVGYATEGRVHGGSLMAILKNGAGK